MSSSPTIQMYRSHPVYQSLINETRQGGSIPVDFVRMDQPPFEATDPASETVSLGLELQPGYTEFSVDFGDGKKVFCATPNDVAYLNPTITETTYWVRDRSIMLLIAAPTASVAAALRVEPSKVSQSLEPLYYRVLSDDGLRARCLNMWQTAAASGPFASLAIDHGFLSLVAGLMAESEAKGIVERLDRGTRGGLDRDRLDRVVDYMEAHLEEPLSLADLSAVSGLSDFHFARAFKRSTGYSPHQFVVLRRLARAKALLAETRRNMADIAQSCGFASSQHLATVFRRMTGATPTAYRRDRAAR